MAVIKKDAKTVLAVKVLTGTTSSGKSKYAERSFSSINPAVTDDDLLTVGTAIGALQSHDVKFIIRRDTCSLRQE